MKLIPGCDNGKHEIRYAFCKGYPEGIPFLLLSGEVDHLEPRPGDNGINWELDENKVYW